MEALESSDVSAVSRYCFGCDGIHVGALPERGASRGPACEARISRAAMPEL